MKVLHYFFSSLVLLGCKQEHSRTSANENETQVIIENHIPMQQKSRPYYTIQIAKGGSSLELSVNDFVVYRHMEQGGLTVNVPINATLMKSGTHDLRLKLNPDKGKTTLDEYTYATIEVRLFADVDDPAGEFQSVLKFDLPDEAKTSNLPYFEVELPFKAEVPFDISHILENAEVLKGQDNIEKEIIAEYEHAHMAFQKLDSQWFTNKRKEANKAVSSTFYLTKAQYEKRNTNFENLFEPAAEVQPMENYEVEYYAGGKIANLVHKTTKAPVLHSILNKGEADQEDITIALGFYRKKGSDSFSAF